jgi:hypothetical protein
METNCFILFTFENTRDFLFQFLFFSFWAGLGFELLEPQLQFTLLWLFWRCGLMNYLPRLA